MQILTLYLTTSVVFLALDIVMLKRVLYVTWGAVLTGVSAWAGVVITRAIFG